MSLQFGKIRATLCLLWNLLVKIYPPPPPRVKCVLMFYIKYYMLIKFCERFGPRSGPTNVGSDRDSNLIKNQQTKEKKLSKSPSRQIQLRRNKRCTQLPWLQIRKWPSRFYLYGYVKRGTTWPRGLVVSVSGYETREPGSISGCATTCIFSIFFFFLVF